MRPLNRPMFRYGGPIKEGVMSGIREPRQNYQSGQLVKPGPGRPGYQGNPYSTNYNLIDWKNANKPYKPINIQSITEVGSSPSNATKIQRVKNLLKSPKFSERGIYGAFKKYIPKAWGAIKTGTKSGLQRFPLITTGVAGEYLTRPRDIDKLVYEQEDYGPWEGRLRKILDPTYNKKWIEAAKKYDFDKKSALGKDEKDKANTVGPQHPSNNPDLYGGLKIAEDAAAAKLAAEKARKAQIQKYRDIMDIKGMNKEAAYKSLIDASKLVSESGDFKGDIKSGKLINQVIQAASKQFDKPAKTSDAINTLILQNELKKDLSAETDALDKEYKRSAIAINEKKLAGTSLNEEISAYRTRHGKNPTAANLEGILLGKDIPVVDVADTVQVDKHIKKGGDEVSFMESIVEANVKEGKSVTPGVYVVKDKIIVIDENGKVKKKR